jgi:hypothetical protein
MTKPLAIDLAKQAVEAVERCRAEGMAEQSAITRAAVKLAIHRNTLRSRLETARNLYGMTPIAPKIAPSRDQSTVEEKSPRDHAHARADALRDEIYRLVTSSRYPLVNPDSIIVEPTLSRRYSRKCGTQTESESAPKTWLSDTLRVAPVLDCRHRAFIFTSAQNDAPIHRAFWSNLQAYAEHTQAEIVVGPHTYASSWWDENNPISRTYAPELREHLCFGQMAIGDNFVFCGEMNTLPTASRPISDLVTYSRGRWAVFPHSKLQLKSVPSTDPTLQAHQVMTTGAVTRPKLIPRKAGVRSLFHNVLGATFVEFDAEGRIFARQLSADDDGSFYDLDCFVDQGGVTRGHRAKAIVFPDLHFAKAAPRNAAALFGVDIRDNSYVDGSLLDELKPEIALLHDTHDMEVGNHHRAGDGHASFELAVRGRTSVMDEVKKLGAFEATLARPWLKVVNVESNHDIALDRYIKEGRYRNDGINLKFGLKLESAMVEYREILAKALDAYEAPPKFSLLETALRDIFGGRLDHVEWAYDGGSYLVDGIECGHHGFRGANGAKGTVAGFARMGRKLTIADKHTPEIMDGVYVAGALELAHGYNRGPSGWATACVVQYASGKRALITLQDGKFRA